MELTVTNRSRGLIWLITEKNKSDLYEVLKVQTLIILDSSMVEHSAVNRVVVGSSLLGEFSFLRLHGQAVKTSPFHGGNTGSNPVGVILAQQCAELKVISRMPMWLNWQSS